MKKRTVKIMSSMLALGLALGACSKGGDTKQTGTDASGSANNAGGEKKIVAWTNNRHDKEYMEDQVKKFNETNGENINLEYVIMTDDYVSTIQTAAAAGKAPDLLSMTATAGIDLKTFVDAGIVVPIGDALSDTYKEVNDVEHQKYEGLTSLGDDIYWVPTVIRSGTRLIYNKDLFDQVGVEVPKTVKESVEVAKKITEAGKGSFYGVVFPGASAPFERWLEGAASMSGIYPYDYVNGKFDFMEYKQVIEDARGFFTEDITFPGSTTLKIDEARAQFANGVIGFYGNASQEVGVLTEQFPAKFDWCAASNPTVDGEIKGALPMTLQGGWLVTKTADYDSAIKAIEFFGSEDHVKGYLERGYGLACSDYMDSKVEKSKIGKLAEFSKQDYESVYPLFPQVSPTGDNYRTTIWNLIANVDMNIEDGLKDLTNRYNEALDKEVKMGKIKRLVIKDYDPLHPSDGTFEYLSE